MEMKVATLGDQGLLCYFEKESEALHFARQVRAAQPEWLVDVVQSYASVAVFHRGRVSETDLNNLSLCAEGDVTEPGASYRIPCCYEMGLDLSHVARESNLSVEEVIRLHSSTEYHVHAIGFCPGFPYLGYLPDRLSGIPRRESPRAKVEAGSVAITGRQTGIYTLPRPGGWSILGRTPLTLVDPEDGYFPLRVGDRVRFEPIDEARFREMEGERLAAAHALSEEFSSLTRSKGT